MATFRYDAHPMGMIISTVAALGTFHPEANPALVEAGEKVYKDIRLRNKQVHRLIGTLPTISAFAYRHRIGRPLVNPAGKNLSYTENFLYMYGLTRCTLRCEASVLLGRSAPARLACIAPV